MVQMILIFALIVFAIVILGTDAIFSESTIALTREDVQKMLEDDFGDKSPLGSELNFYGILTALVVPAAIGLKYALFNTNLFGRKPETEEFKKYQKEDTGKQNFDEWSEQRIEDLKEEIKDQKEIITAMQDKISAMLVDVRNHREISVIIKDDVKELKYEIKEQRRILSDLEIKIGVVEKLFDRHDDRSKGGGERNR